VGGTLSGGTGGLGSGGTGPRECSVILQDAGEKLEAAKACTVDGIYPECDDIVEGLCCNELVANEENEAAQDYLAVVAEAQEATCDPQCPDACPTVLAGYCAGDNGGPGTCAQGPK
jgi:hypothetical protein